MYRKKWLKVFTVFLLFCFIFSIYYININGTFNVDNNRRITIASDIILNERDKISWSTCNNLVNGSNIHLLSNKHERDLIFRHKYPPYLISYPGSGNTFTRILIEYITNIYTGSVFNDYVLINEYGFKGELYCFNETSVIKLHPRLLQKKYPLWINGTCPCGCIRYKDFRVKKYGKSDLLDEMIYYDNIWKPLTGIFIIRDPWSAIFTEYQYSEGRKSSWISSTIHFGKKRRRIQKWPQLKHVHVHHVRKSDFNSGRFKGFVQANVKRYMELFKTIKDFQENNYEHLIIKFERLISIVNEKENFNEIQNVIKFLYNEKYYNENKNILQKKIKCLNQFIIRNDKRMNAIKRSSNDIFMEAFFATKKYAYNSLDKPFLCGVWRAMEKELKYYGYHSWNDTDCSIK